MLIYKSQFKTDEEYKRDYAKEYAKSREPKQRQANILRKRARRKMGLEQGDEREVDHIKPLSKGGSNADSNLRVVSRKTNRTKADKKK